MHVPCSIVDATPPCCRRAGAAAQPEGRPASSRTQATAQCPATLWRAGQPTNQSHHSRHVRCAGVTLTGPHLACLADSAQSVVLADTGRPADCVGCNHVRVFAVPINNTRCRLICHSHLGSTECFLVKLVPCVRRHWVYTCYGNGTTPSRENAHAAGYLESPVCSHLQCWPAAFQRLDSCVIHSELAWWTDNHVSGRWTVFL